MFDLLAKLCQKGESFIVNYHKENSGQVRLVITPQLHDEPDTLTDETALNCRALLVRPLVMRGSHSSVVRQFHDYVSQTADARADLSDSYTGLIDTMSASAQQARRTKSEKQAKADTANTMASEPSQTPVAPPSEKPAESTDGAQPSNLFG